MTIDLSSLGSAMYYSTAARKQEMDMDREQQNIIAERQQNQARAEEMQQQKARTKSFSEAYSKQVDQKTTSALVQNQQIWQGLYNERAKSGDIIGAKQAQEQVDKIEIQKKNEQDTILKAQKDMRERKSMIGAAYSPNDPESTKMFNDELTKEGYKENDPRRSDPTFIAAKQKEWDAAAQTSEQRQQASLSVQKHSEDLIERKRSEDEKERHNKEMERLTAQLRASKEAHIGDKKLTNSEKMIANTMNTTMAEAAQSMENLDQLTQSGKVKLSTGAYNNISDHGMFGATAASLGQSITTQDKQMYESIMLPLARMTATAQGGGRYRTNEASVKQSIEAFITKSGQTHMTMLEKIAELKQTLAISGESALEAGNLNSIQETSMRKNIDRINKSVPWNVNDVVEFYNKGGKAENFGDYLKKKNPPDESDWKPL